MGTDCAAGAGAFASFRRETENLWAYERKTHEGPVFGEGLNHWLWSGYSDGVEAALGAGDGVLVIATPEHRAAALEKAARVRRERAVVKEKLKMGNLTLDQLLTQADSDETVGKMKVVSVLESLPGLGKVKARRLMETVGISDSRRLQGLGAKQRESLLKETAR